MGKSIKESVEFGSPEDIRLDNLEVMRSRCRSFLDTKTSESHEPWIKCNDDLYVSNCKIFVEDIGEIYKSEIERVSDGKSTKYLLKFSDINQIFDNQSYRPLRQLGALVFQNATIN